jgi:uncharacterized membrane protein
MRYCDEATPRGLWFNFAFLFSISLLPVSIAWMAVSERAPQPVAFYMAVFFLMNATYIGLIYELIERSPVDAVSLNVRRAMRFRSNATLIILGSATLVALEYPLAGLGMCVAVIALYLVQPE